MSGSGPRRHWVLLAALVLGVVGGVYGGLPSWARVAHQKAPDRIDDQWTSFAADLAAASGARVSYVPATASALSRSATIGRETALLPSEMLRHGGVSVLRIGATSGPTVLVLPSTISGHGELGRAFEEVGLKEPRRLVQTLVMAAMREDEAPLGTSRALDLRGLLRDFAIAIPVRVTDPVDLGIQGGAVGVDPSRNFSVRWEEAAHGETTDGTHNGVLTAGLYPGSHPRVRALMAWLYQCTDCTHVVLVDPGAQAEGSTGHGAGSLGAFCQEGLGMEVHSVPARDLMVELESALKGCCRLMFQDPEWERLGPANWVLRVTLTNWGLKTAPGVSRVFPSVRIRARLGDSGVQLTAVACTRAGSLGPPGTAETAMELLPLQREGVVAGPLGPGERHHLRLFFTASGAAAPPDTEPGVELTATSMAAKRAVLTTDAF